MNAPMETEPSIAIPPVSQANILPQAFKIAGGVDRNPYRDAWALRVMREAIEERLL